MGHIMFYLARIRGVRGGTFYSSSRVGGPGETPRSLHPSSYSSVLNPPPHESHSHFCLGVGLGTQVRARPWKPPHPSCRYRWEASSQAQLRSRHSLAQGNMKGPRKTRIFTTISHGSRTWYA